MAWEDKVRNEYNEAKAKFYAKPTFAATVGLVVGIAIGWLIF